MDKDIATVYAIEEIKKESKNFTVDEIELIKEQYPVLGISIVPQLPRQ